MWSGWFVWYTTLKQNPNVRCSHCWVLNIHIVECCLLLSLYCFLEICVNSLTEKQLYEINSPFLSSISSSSYMHCLMTAWLADQSRKWYAGNYLGRYTRYTISKTSASGGLDKHLFKTKQPHRMNTIKWATSDSHPLVSGVGHGSVLVLYPLCI